MTETGPSFLAPAEASAAAQRLYDDDLSDSGYVMNLSRLWAHNPALLDGLSTLIGESADAGSLTFRQRGILISACASTLGDSYCSLAWGARLAREVGDDAASGVLRGNDDALDPAEQVLARWARLITRDPNATSAGDVQALRDAGFNDPQIHAITTFVALRVAFSTVNDALGTRPDRSLAERVPLPVREAVTFGRPVADQD